MGEDVICNHLDESVYTDNEGKLRYRCLSCGEVLREYNRWYHALWVTCPRGDVGDRFVVPQWMGSVGELYDARRNTATFAILPLNALIDLSLKLLRFLKYRVPGKLCHDLEMSYRRGKVDGARENMAGSYRPFQQAYAAEVAELKGLLAEQDEQIKELKDELKELRP